MRKKKKIIKNSNIKWGQNEGNIYQKAKGTKQVFNRSRQMTSEMCQFKATWVVETWANYFL